MAQQKECRDRMAHRATEDSWEMGNNSPDRASEQPPIMFTSIPETGEEQIAGRDAENQWQH